MRWIWDLMDGWLTTFEFIPYWQSDTPAKTASEEVLASLYRTQNEALLVVSKSVLYRAWQAHGDDEWVRSLIEELAGIQSDGKLLERVLCCPRWAVTKARKVTATAHFPASDTYFAYHYGRSRDRIKLRYTGTGSSVSFRILLPGWTKCTGSTVNGRRVKSKLSQIETSRYIEVEAAIAGVSELVVAR